MKTLRLFLLMTLLLGILYPAFTTLIAQRAFPYQANGSIIKKDKISIGSELIAQEFKSPAYFHPRPSACNYNPPSSASNLGPTSQTKRLSTSGSGLDPHITPEDAKSQVQKVATERHIDPTKLNELITQFTEPRDWGIFGEPRVNVLNLNRALDQTFPGK